MSGCRAGSRREQLCSPGGVALTECGQTFAVAVLCLDDTSHAIVARLYPEQFPYHPNWKADSTHPAFVSRSATLDHVVQIADEGDLVDPENLVTACWGYNRRKGDLRLDEIGWSLVEPANKAWKGLTELFFPLWEAAGRPDLSEDEAWWLRATRTTDTLDR
jgi:5-methylcytosine-specific restriction endonuclease McrA